MNRLEGKSKLEQTKKGFSEIIDRGEEIEAQGEQVERVLQSISLDGLDSEDIGALDTAKSGYSSDFGSEMGKVNEDVEEMAGEAASDVQGLEGGKEQVNDAKAKFEQASSASEIGKRNAEQGSAQMENSSQEYEQLIAENNKNMEEARNRAKNLSSRIGALFG